MNTTDITAKTLEELKVLAYDELAQVNLHTQNLRIIEERIHAVVAELPQNSL